MLDYIKIGALVALVSSVGGAVWYVMDLRADNAALVAQNTGLQQLADERAEERDQARKEAKQQLRRERALHAAQMAAKDERDEELAKIRPAVIDKANNRHPDWMAKLANNATQKLFDQIENEAAEK